MPFLKPVDPCQDSVAQAPGSPDRAGFARSGVEALLPVPAAFRETHQANRIVDRPRLRVLNILEGTQSQQL